MIFIKSKRGSVFIFLMELLLLAAFIGFMFAATTKIVTNEGKYRAFNVENLGLFMERIPSVDNNFYYEFKFVNKNGSMKVKVKFDKDVIYLDKPGTKEPRYFYEYQVPEKFQIAEEFDEVDTLYFYKYGDEFKVLKEKDDDLLYYMDLIPNLPMLNPSYENLGTNYLSSLCNADVSKIFVILQKGDSNTIYFSPETSNFVFNRYNEVVEYFAKKQELSPLSLELISEPEQLLPDLKPFFDVNSCSAGINELKLVLVDSLDNNIRGRFS